MKKIEEKYITLKSLDNLIKDTSTNIKKMRHTFLSDTLANYVLAKQRSFDKLPGVETNV